mgnify:CR=1 FL=1
MATMRLDLRGLNCPEPVLRASRAIREVEVGDALVLECTDPLTTIDIPLFVSRAGHLLERQERQDGLLVFTIVRSK